MVAKFTYRGDSSEEFSNTYHFKDAPPSDDSAWATFFAGMLAICRPIVPSTVTWDRAYGYDSDDAHAHAVADIDWSSGSPPNYGTFSPTSGDIRFAGDQAALVEFRTDRKNSRGKWVYLRKYLHVGSVNGTTPDDLATDYATVLATYAAAIGGPSSPFHGGLRSRTHDDTITDVIVAPYVTTRTLKRRGKRPLG